MDFFKRFNFNSKGKNRDIVIAFLGPSGSGKSNLIDLLTNQPGQRAGKSLASHTKEVTCTRIANHEDYGDKIVLVDAPGFDDDSFSSDIDTVVKVNKWLKHTYRAAKLTGIIYLQRITDNRMSGTPNRNLRLFGELCGAEGAKYVVLVTTMWDNVRNAQLAEDREESLMTQYWDVMIQQGASTARFYNTSESAWRIIKDMITKNPISRTLLLEDGIDELKESLKATKAGKVLYDSIEKLLAKQREILKAIAKQSKNRKDVTHLNEEYEQVQRQLYKKFLGVAELNISIGKKIKLFFDLNGDVAQGVDDDTLIDGSSSRVGSQSLQSLISRDPNVSRARRVKTGDLTKNDIIIAMIGPTGSGKSTFIYAATGIDLGIGHGLTSCTNEIDMVKVSFPEWSKSDIVFVDTPGFDHTYRSDFETLGVVSEWLKTTYENDILLTGILYFHRISDIFPRSPPRTLRMFQAMCGRDFFNNVVFTTTMWDDISLDIAYERERNLKSTHWKEMLKLATTQRFTGERDSALQILEPFFDTAKCSPRANLLQIEIFNKPLGGTSAGQQLLLSDPSALVKAQGELLTKMDEANGGIDLTSFVNFVKECHDLNDLAAKLKEFHKVE